MGLGPSGNRIATIPGTTHVDEDHDGNILMKSVVHLMHKISADELQHHDCLWSKREAHMNCCAMTGTRRTMCSCAGCRCNFSFNQHSNAVLHQTVPQVSISMCRTCARCKFATINEPVLEPASFQHKLQLPRAFTRSTAVSKTATLGCSLFFQLEHITQSLCTLPFVAVVM